MSDTRKMFDQLLDHADNPIVLNAALIVEKTTGRSVAEHMCDTTVHPTQDVIQGLVDASVEALKTGDVRTLSEKLESLTTTVSAFLTGEDNNNETLDRLSELVAAIKANKDSIDALVADHVRKGDIVDDLTTGGAQKALSAEQGKTLKGLLDALQSSVESARHEHANKAVLDKFGESAGKPTFNGATIGETGWAFVAGPDEPAVFNGKVKAVVVEYDAPAA